MIRKRSPRINPDHNHDDDGTTGAIRVHPRANSESLIALGDIAHRLEEGPGINITMQFVKTVVRPPFTRV